MSTYVVNKFNKKTLVLHTLNYSRLAALNYSCLATLNYSYLATLNYSCLGHLVKNSSRVYLSSLRLLINKCSDTRSFGNYIADQPTNQPTNQPTSQRTDKVSYRVACPQLKSELKKRYFSLISISDFIITRNFVIKCDFSPGERSLLL